jgi:Flp pilus assembly protein TadG
MSNLRKCKMISRFFRKGERGVASLELALSLLFVVFFIVGMLELVMLVYTYNVLADSAKEGVRYAIVRGCGTDTSTCSGTCSPACSDASAANVKSAVTTYAQLSLHSTATMTVNVNYADADSSAPHRVQVTVSYPYQPFFGVAWLPSLTVHAAAAGRIAY